MVGAWLATNTNLVGWAGPPIDWNDQASDFESSLDGRLIKLRDLYFKHLT